jgi:hypothetical protein
LIEPQFLSVRPLSGVFPNQKSSFRQRFYYAYHVFCYDYDDGSILHHQVTPPPLKSHIKEKSVTLITPHRDSEPTEAETPVVKKA